MLNDVQWQWLEVRFKSNLIEHIEIEHRMDLILMFCNKGFFLSGQIDFG